MILLPLPVGQEVDRAQQGWMSLHQDVSESGLEPLGGALPLTLVLAAGWGPLFSVWAPPWVFLWLVWV